MTDLTTLPPITDSPPPSDLKSRLVVGMLLIALALGDLWLGGWWFAALVAVGGLLIFTEWAVMHAIPRGWRLMGLTVLGAVCLVVESGYLQLSVAGLLAAALALGLLAKLAKVGEARWMAGGLLYAGLPAIALIWLREQP